MAGRCRVYARVVLGEAPMSSVPHTLIPRRNVCGLLVRVFCPSYCHLQLSTTMHLATIDHVSRSNLSAWLSKVTSLPSNTLLDQQIVQNELPVAKCSSERTCGSLLIKIFVHVHVFLDLNLRTCSWASGSACA